MKEFQRYEICRNEGKLTSAPRTPAYWRSLRNRLQALACEVNVYSKEYKNLCSRIKWIHDNRLKLTY